MTLDTTDIIIIVVAVVITVLLTLCLVNLCYYLWLKRNKSFTGRLKLVDFKINMGKLDLKRSNYENFSERWLNDESFSEN